MEQDLSPTAFLTNLARAALPAVSRDPYAARWISPDLYPRVARLREDYAREVCPQEDLGLAVRNRYFLERLEQHAALEPELVFVNIGAGFTSYPFVVQVSGAIEVDLPHVVARKAARMEQLRQQGELPDRDVSLVGVDLRREEGLRHLEEILLAGLRDRPSFALIEGLTYYLPFPILERLLHLLRTAQRPGSRLALDFWSPEVADHPVFARLQRFYSQRFGHEPGGYALFDERSLERLAGYRVVEVTDAPAQEAALEGRNADSASSSTFTERFALLERL